MGDSRGSPSPLDAFRDALRALREHSERIGQALRQWYQDLRLRTQLVIWLVSSVGVSLLVNLLTPHVVRFTTAVFTAMSETQLTALAIIQTVLTLLGWILAQNFFLMRSLNTLHDKVDDMESSPRQEPDGGRSQPEGRTFWRRGNPVSTSGGGFVGGAIIGGAWGATFGIEGVVTGIVVGALIGDAVEQQVMLRKQRDDRS